MTPLLAQGIIPGKYFAESLPPTGGFRPGRMLQNPVSDNSFADGNEFIVGILVANIFFYSRLRVAKRP